MKSTLFVAEDFVNSIGQTISPGDNVVYVGTSWSRTSVNPAVFAGVYKNSKGEITAVRVNYRGERWMWDSVTSSGSYVGADCCAVLRRKRVLKIDESSEEVAKFFEKSI